MGLKLFSDTALTGLSAVWLESAHSGIEIDDAHYTPLGNVTTLESAHSGIEMGANVHNVQGGNLRLESAHSGIEILSSSSIPSTIR